MPATVIVVPAMKLMLDDNGYGLSKRRVTLSTSGVVPMIDKLGDEIDVSLAISLHASTDELRNELVPINRKYNIRALLDACHRYLAKCPDNGYGLSKRRVTLSTSGVVPMIDKLGDEIDVSLAISLHASTDELRNELVPINRKYNIRALLDACHRYLAKCPDNRQVTIEYTLIKDVNDQQEHAEQLAALLKELPCKINLIPFNPFPNSGYEKPSRNQVMRFQQWLYDLEYNATVRMTRGDDIDAACGQLVGRVKDRTKRSARYIQSVQLDAD